MDDSIALRGLTPLLRHQEGRDVLMAIELTEDNLPDRDEAEEHGECGVFGAGRRLGLRPSAKFAIEIPLLVRRTPLRADRRPRRAPLRRARSLPWRS